MGLDTSHGCWEGPYSMFDRWRSTLSNFVMHERAANDPVAKELSYLGWTQEAYVKALDSNMYEDQTVPINVLLAHSDCDGEIPAAICAPLADALQAIADKHMPQRGIYDEKRPATERFIAGLRLAASNSEAVRFG